MHDLPAAFLEAMQGQLGDEFEAFCASYAQEALRGVRLNPRKQPSHLQPEGLGEAVPWCRDGYYLSMDSRCGLQVLHEAGAWYLQEPSAMLPAAVLDVQPGETVWDIAKRYRVAMEDISRLNTGLADAPAPGTPVMPMRRALPVLGRSRCSTRWALAK